MIIFKDEKFLYLFFLLIVSTIVVLFRRLASFTGTNRPVFASRPTLTVVVLLRAIELASFTMKNHCYTTKSESILTKE
jgi:hypothetical protein